MKRSIFAVVVLGLFLALVEGLGRLMLETPRPAHTFDDDPELGWVLPAAARFDFGGQSVQTNAWRMRSPAPRGGVKTVISLGDSSVFGHGVEDDEHFSARLGVLLGEEVQVLNAGVPGYTCPQVLGALGRVPVDVDVAVLYPGISDSFIIEGKDQVALPAGLERIRTTGIGRLLLVVATKRSLGRVRVSPGDFEVCLAELVDSVPAAVVVVPLEEGDLGGPTSWHDPRVAHLLPYREAMRRVAESSEVPLIDLPAIAQASGQSADGLLLDVVHPSEQGHEVIAEGIEAVLTAEGLLQ
ncbi:MAG TPA: GDSL-type esterase/lipase family protein [Myxococcota bacterium]|nr:GDSL-type esterase/lipase family protein [Myxococcota bacterium]